MNPVPLPIRLSPINRRELREHFCALGPEDRHLRFGTMISDEAIASYVDHIDFERDAVFGIFEDDLTLAGAAHVAVGGGVAELGVSVLPGYRGRGLGTALFDRAGMHARNARIGELFMHCLTENSAMMRIAKRAGMQIVSGFGEADAHLKLAPGDASSFTREVMQDRLALFDYALRSQVLTAKRIGEAVLQMPASATGVATEPGQE